MSVLGTTKHSSCNQCIGTWQYSHIVLYCIHLLSEIRIRFGLKSSSVPPVNTVPHGGQIKSLWERSLFTTFPSDHEVI